MSLEGLGEYSHAWIIFHFHQNGEKKKLKPKTKPPRLRGKKIGVFASRTPHRPNELGLTLVKLDKIDLKSGYVYVSGVDLVNGTPIIDIKPYIQPDSPCTSVRFPDWHSGSSDLKDVVFSKEAEDQIVQFCQEMKFYDDETELKKSIREIILLDPRSNYRKTKCLFDDYYIHFDKLNILCRLQDDEKTMEVVRMKVTYDDVCLKEEEGCTGVDTKREKGDGNEEENKEGDNEEMEIQPKGMEEIIESN